MKKHILTLAALACCTIAGAAGAADAAMSKDAYKAEKDRIEADYKAAKAKCDVLKDNAKDICNAQAKGDEKIAKAKLEAQYKPSPAHQEKVRRVEADAAYDIAKEKCDDQKGNAKDACQKEAKATHTSALADLKKSSKS